MRDEYVTDMDQTAMQLGRRRWGAEVRMGMSTGSKSVLPYLRLEGVAGSTSIMSAATWEQNPLPVCLLSAFDEQQTNTPQVDSLK